MLLREEPKLAQVTDCNAEAVLGGPPVVWPAGGVFPLRRAGIPAHEQEILLVHL